MELRIVAQYGALPPPIRRIRRGDTAIWHSRRTTIQWYSDMAVWLNTSFNFEFVLIRVCPIHYDTMRPGFHSRREKNSDIGQIAVWGSSTSVIDPIRHAYHAIVELQNLLQQGDGK